MKRTLPCIISRQQAAKLLLLPNVKTLQGLRDKVILQLLYRCGLRNSELCNLLVDNVNLAEGYIIVRKGKRDKDRIIPLDKETLKLLKNWLVVKPPGDYVACGIKPNNAGQKLSSNFIRLLIREYSQKAGIYITTRQGKRKPIHPHVLRHACLTELLEEGFTLPEVQEIAGHEDISTTQVYMHVRPEALIKKMRNRKLTTAN